MALDGSCMEVADEAANAEYFGYPGASRGQSAFPQARLLGLVECGTHVVVAAEVAPYGHSEQVMAAQMLPAKLRPDMLGGRPQFLRIQALEDCLRQRFQLAWRVKSNLKLAVLQMLPDGSTSAPSSTAGPTSRRRASRTCHRLHAAGLGHPATGQLPVSDQHPGSRTGAGARVGGAVPRALGDRGGLR